MPKKNTIYISFEDAEEFITVLDNARIDGQGVVENAQNATLDESLAALAKVCKVAQWIVHMPKFLPIHQKNWKARFGNDQ